MRKKWLLLYNIACIIFLTCSAHPNLIESYRIVNKNKIVVKANKRFSKKFIKEDFFAEYDKSIDLTKLDESIVTIPFILTIIPVVWVSNENYSIDVMDKDLYYSLQEVKKVFRIFYPQQKWAGELVPQRLVTNSINRAYEPVQSTVAVLFSGGLDSVNTSINYVDQGQLLITAWGADVKVRANQEWRYVLEQAQQFSQKYDHKHTFVKSNFREFTETGYLYAKFSRWWVRVSHALSLIGLVGPLLVVHNIPTLLISSTYTLKHPYPYGSHPAIDNNISLAGSNIYHADADKDRIQKIINIIDVCKERNMSLPGLRVCWSDPKGGNCLKCDKCLRTIFNIIAAGQLPKEFGFTIEIPEDIHLLRRFFKQQKYLKDDSLMFWQNNWLYLSNLSKQARVHAVLSKQDTKILQEFLYSFDLDQYRNPRASLYSPQEHELFTMLWKQNMKKVKI